MMMAVKAHLNTFLSMDPGISESILNSLRDQICLIDAAGMICFVNDEWKRFAERNGGTLSDSFLGMNYLEQCKNEAAVHQGLQAILNGDLDCFNHEYPCHSPTKKRWFLMQATPLQANKEGIEGAVIRHVDITKQKILELQLKDYAEKDPLTSLYNRRYFEEQLEKEVDRALQRGSYLALLYIDTDNFKEINDAYGHPAGDQVLKALAFQITQATRPSDIAARIGGDEFAILLPDTDKAQLTVIAERLSLYIQHVKVREQGCPIDVTVSIGGKSFKDNFPLNAMVKWVDKALYSAKARGKNQVVISD